MENSDLRDQCRPRIHMGRRVGQWSTTLELRMASTIIPFFAPHLQYQLQIACGERLGLMDRWWRSANITACRVSFLGCQGRISRLPVQSKPPCLVSTTLTSDHSIGAEV